MLHWKKSKLYKGKIMLHFKFPTIYNIKDVLPVIKDAEEFVVIDKGDYIVVNYMVSLNTTFPPITDLHSMIRRECRGIIFNKKDGNIASRRLHKFFNINEKEETLYHNIDFSIPHKIMTKYDGSFIAPIYLDDKIIWGTKSGVTDVSRQVLPFLKNNPAYLTFVEYCKEKNLTPTFEWCTRKQKIILDYPVDRLILIAVRNLYTGEYIEFSTLEHLDGIDIAESFSVEEGNNEKFIESVKDAIDTEGYVIRFNNGHMLKVKSDWYVIRHKTKDKLLFEKNILSLIFNNQLDDQRPFIDKVDLDRINNYEHKVLTALSTNSKILYNLLTKYRQYANCDKKTFALTVCPELNSFETSMAFSTWNDWNYDNFKEVLYNYIKKNSLNSQTKVNNIKWLWNNITWNYDNGEV